MVVIYIDLCYFILTTFVWLTLTGAVAAPLPRCPRTSTHPPHQRGSSQRERLPDGCGSDGEVERCVAVRGEMERSGRGLGDWGREATTEPNQTSPLIPTKSQWARGDGEVERRDAARGEKGTSQTVSPTTNGKYTNDINNDTNMLSTESIIEGI